MDASRLMNELLRAARKLSLEVRIEPFEPPPTRAGGLCWFRGRQVVLLDQNAPQSAQVATLAAALGTFDLEPIYLTPEARRIVEATRQPPR